MSYAMIRLQAQIRDLIAQAVGQEFDHNQLEITVPPSAELGDLAVPCFYLSKLLRLSPNQIAVDLQSKINPAGIIKDLQPVGPYLNITLNPAVLAGEVLAEVKKLKTKYGLAEAKADSVDLEFSCPNTHKEFHIGHTRNVILGAALANIYTANGHQVAPLNYIGDIGAHVAKCLWALDKFHHDEEPPADKAKYLGQIYSEATTKLEAQPEYKAEIDDVLAKLESGDKSWLALWKKTRQWSLDDFDRIYKLLGVKFKHAFYESEVEKPGKKLVADLLERGIAEKSQGAVIINLDEYALKQFLLLKSDGSSLYSTKDLALAQLKFKKYPADRSLHVIDNRQTFYLQQLFKTFAIIGITTPSVHISYEMVTLKEGAMSSRAGNIITFDSLYDELTARAKAETAKRHQDWSADKVEATARALALSAIKFNMIKVSNDSIITFDLDEALSFDGYSGPYLQYTASRINSLLTKAGKIAWARPDYSPLTLPIEKELLLKLADFPLIIAIAGQESDPSIVARYLFELSQLFSTFYQQAPIINSDEVTKKARLTLSSAVRQVLVNGMSLIGLEALDQM